MAKEMEGRYPGAFVADISTCAGLADLYAVFRAEVLRLGFDHYSMAIVPLDPKFQAGPLLHGTFPDAYIHGYAEIDAHTIDPYLSLMAKRTKPFFHAEILPQFQTTEIGRKLTILALENDIHHGYMVPLPTTGFARGVGFWAGKACMDFNAIVEAEAAYLNFIAMHLMAAAEDLGFSPEPIQPVKLTSREQDILYQCAEGMTNQEISAHLAISERTVRFHLTNAYRKLGTTRRAQAATRSIAMGLIDTRRLSGSESAPGPRFF